MEGLAVPLSAARCTDDGNGGNSSGSYTSCENASEGFGRDIAQLITLDTPHLGAILASLANWAANADISFSACLAPSELNVRELMEGSYVINTLNGPITEIPFPGPNITAVPSYVIPLLPLSDAVVTVSEQSINAVSSRY